MELSEYSLEFRPRRAIKAQILADFLAECSFNDQQPYSPSYADTVMVLYDPTIVQNEAHYWSIYVDGSFVGESGGAGVLLIRPDYQQLQYSFRFLFPVTNNAAEYEALLAGLRMAN